MTKKFFLPQNSLALVAKWYYYKTHQAQPLNMRCLVWYMLYHITLDLNLDYANYDEVTTKLFRGCFVLWLLLLLFLLLLSLLMLFLLLLLSLMLLFREHQRLIWGSLWWKLSLGGLWGGGVQKLCLVVVSFVRWGSLQNFRPLGPLFLVEFPGGWGGGWWWCEQQ